MRTVKDSKSEEEGKKRKGERRKGMLRPQKRMSKETESRKNKEG